MKRTNYWLAIVIIHVVFMGVWGAFIEIPEKNGFPTTLGYVVWSLTMIPTAIAALIINKWKLDTDKRSVVLGFSIGILGAGGQLALFHTLRIAPAYLVFPLLSLTPVITVSLALLFLKEKTGRLGWLGIIGAIAAILALSYRPPDKQMVQNNLWILLTAIPLLAWGSQGFTMRFANKTMKAESIFFYMMLSAVLLIPIPLLMTDFHHPINWGADGLYLAAGIQLLNALGALFLVYAFRLGKAIIIAPMTTALSPVLTVVISLLIYAILPHPVIVLGMCLAIGSAFLIVKAETAKKVT